ncbi:MAG: hypothetical protein ACYDD0_03635 [Candidatus Dormibacteria bacterium]
MSRHRRRKVRGAASAAPTEPLPAPVRPELGIADLLGAASAWASAHPREAVEALTAVFEGARIAQSDPRLEACKQAVKAAIGGEYRGPTADRLAALFQAGGPRAITAAFHRASVTARYRQDLAEVAAAK